ncbi:protein phosphatase regulator [Elasticomyces elasticus]|nr:protein phosphatase regulator [Elasticomyces elasticus]KAK3667368.1 protein phosphatase regulator [Elasticomyces elasticus]KAK4932552.1 protein phosphatase regulator [Elasticomyces elasticus]KAK5769574.1 protein phosphatase regulator [Elasticomyces elasticus]
MDDEQANKVAQLSEITGVNPSIGQSTLESTNWNLEAAAELIFASADADMDDPTEETPSTSTPNPTAPTPQQQPQAESSSSANPSSRRPPGQRPKAMTLGDLQRAQNDEDDEDDEDKPRDLFAGGEKSGLAVQDPSKQPGPMDHFKNIMNQAKQNRSRPGGDDETAAAPAGSANFRGPAQTLGEDDAPSRPIGHPAPPTAGAGGRQAPAALPRVTRTLHLWADGVSIDDGPLFRFDDPANADMMAQINEGRAPLSLLSVAAGQEVDLSLVPHKEENYVKPKTVWKPFGGSGNRLGSPTPGPSAAPSQPAPAAQAAPQAQAQAQASSAGGTAEMDVDPAAPTIQLQIRLGDGTQLRSRFNTTHTIEDVYEFVNRASAASTQRPWALMTTFPSKELSDKGQVLGEMADFKRGGVVVQKWT